ncbi:hypothetical protein LF845_06325 [Deferribacterales bacterium Es71-Z0220]|uniref:transcription termination/antitermination protein NusG n=1 Tax=Deferrivibrio essentukiensis TaxID=2880922 RepID=UPI001F611E43|nr:transcription termination/antitermination NusG family protein [Deferrivibrio essentukiensis]MCB4204572.1 hypothetical protein [Deferrivibrio essentukiensis]
MNWYCIYYKPNCFKVVAIHLSRLNGEYEIYSPKLKYVKVINGKKVEKYQDLFPCYFFLKIDEEKLSLVRFTRGVKKILGNYKGDYSVIDENFIDSLKSAENEDGYIFFENDKKFEKGEQLEIIDGPFKGLSAQYLYSLSSQERVAILLNVANSSTKIIIDKHLVKPRG